MERNDSWTDTRRNEYKIDVCVDSHLVYNQIYNWYKHGAAVVWDHFHIIVKQEFVQIPASLTGTNIYYLLNFYVGCNIKHDGPRHGWKQLNDVYRKGSR